MLGACTGFLWWNAAPAKIFMGDTGSLAIGAALAGLGLSTNTQLLLILICGLYVAETVSVILQVGSFKLTGKRIFRMAPIHHHFELRGLARDHRHRALLDPGRAVHRAGPGDLLRRLRAPRGQLLSAPDRALVVGFGVTGQAVARALRQPRPRRWWWWTTIPRRRPARQQNWPPWT